jgi:histidyl-tRNA synthetase
MSEVFFSKLASNKITDMEVNERKKVLKLISYKKLSNSIKKVNKKTYSQQITNDIKAIFQKQNNDIVIIDFIKRDNETLYRNAISDEKILRILEESYMQKNEESSSKKKKERIFIIINSISAISIALITLILKINKEVATYLMLSILIIMISNFIYGYFVIVKKENK